MPLFSIKRDRLERVKEVPFKSERKDIQKSLNQASKKFLVMNLSSQSFNSATSE